MDELRWSNCWDTTKTWNNIYICMYVMNGDSPSLALKGGFWTLGSVSCGETKVLLRQCLDAHSHVWSRRPENLGLVRLRTNQDWKIPPIIEKLGQFQNVVLKWSGPRFSLGYVLRLYIQCSNHLPFLGCIWCFWNPQNCEGEKPHVPKKNNTVIIKKKGIIRTTTTTATLKLILVVRKWEKKRQCCC